MADSQIHMPGVFGGLVRYNEEYESRVMLTPNQVILFLVFVVLFVLALKLFWPVSG